jgi:His-Xaa-Ser system radical SAM maturase HxsB
VAKRFLPAERYQKSRQGGYRLLPFRFTALRGNSFVLTNMAGEYLVAERDILGLIVRHQLPLDTHIYAQLKSRHFIEDDDSGVAQELLALKVRTKSQHLEHFTSLHIFVVSLRCEHSCPYCQVSRQSGDKVAFDMSLETAMKSLDLAFRTPAKAFKIEFQGGEPLLNFELIKQIVLEAEQRAIKEEREVAFVIATNLAIVTEDILDFCNDHSILISTSLDGPRDLHNQNRPRPGKDSYERTIAGIELSRKALGRDRVSALMTTTRFSLRRASEIVDEYRRLGFDQIFLRALSPYGFAVKTKSINAYDAAEWLQFYKEGLDHVIKLNLNGERFVERYAAIILTKMLTPFNPGYVDLMSPAGIGTQALVYNYDGDIYASDEGRMLAEMGDKTFRLGNAMTDSYEDIIFSDALLNPIEDSFTGSVPMCSECAFEPFCGAEPVFHHATQGDPVGHKPTSGFCTRNMEIFRHLIELMENSPEIEQIFRSWVASR